MVKIQISFLNSKALRGEGGGFESIFSNIIQHVYVLYVLYVLSAVETFSKLLKSL